MENIKELVEFLGKEIRTETDEARSYGGDRGDDFDSRIAKLTRIKEILELQVQNTKGEPDEVLVEKVYGSGYSVGVASSCQSSQVVLKLEFEAKAEIRKLLEAK